MPMNRNPEVRFSAELSDHALGMLEYIEEQDGYVGEFELDGLSVELFLFATADYPKIADRIAVAHRLLAMLKERDIRRDIAPRVRKLYEDGWRETREAVADEGIAERLSLESIHIDGEGGVGLSFDDGDLFFGHFVDVQLTPKFKIEHVGISG